LARAALHIAAIGLLAVLFAMTVQARGEQTSQAANPAPGVLVDIGGGERLHLRIWGEPNDRPTIILDVSAAQPSSIWAWIARDLSTDYQVVAYDRPGMAWSVGVPGRDAQSAADALTTALGKVGIGGQYVVVGHSFGGLSARVFAADHPEDLAGLVLLDTTYPTLGGGGWYAATFRSEALQGHTGMLQLFPPDNPYGSLPEQESDSAFAVTLWASHRDATADEMDEWDASVSEVLQAGSFGDVPLLVVSTPGTPDEVELERRLTELSSNSQFLVMNTSHMAMLMDEAAAGETARAIREFVTSF
jgi:pimeloyl-ACP methyl ester carboxylesterase